MRFRKPSPSMVVATAALVMASTGSAVAAINYAQRAGAVDGFSAVGPRSSTKTSAGKLVATRRKGETNAGQIPNKFLGDVTQATTFSRGVDVADNAPGAPFTLHTSAFGPLSATCNDQSNTPGVEDPTTTISFANTASFTVNLARQTGNQAAFVAPVTAGTANSFTINGSNTFHIQLEAGGYDFVYDGHVRQDGRGTPTGGCVIVGTVEEFRP